MFPPPGAGSSRKYVSVCRLRNDRIINFVYQLLFTRDAEAAALEHWRPYLAEGLTDLDFFLTLWNSAEISTWRAEAEPLHKAASETRGQ